MVNKELKKLSRRELVDIIYQLKKNEQEMQEQIAALQKELKDKRIRVAVAGSIADVAIDVSKILDAAQETADVYLYEIASMKVDAEVECKEMLNEAKLNAAKILSEAKKNAESVER